MDSDYTIDDALAVLGMTVERKAEEIEALQKKIRRAKKQDRKDALQELADYLEADRIAYLSVIADMTDDDGLLEGIDADSCAVECPRMYDEYLSQLDADDLENELDAEEIRADYCDEILEIMCECIGEEALNSKKMIKVLQEDPYICQLIGECIFYDDDLYAYLTEIIAKKKEKKGKKKSKKKKD